MKYIYFNNKHYNIPQRWVDVNLEMLIRSEELMDIFEDSPITAIISAYTKIPISELNKAKASEVADIIETMAFVNQPYESKPEYRFNFSGNDYMCDEDLLNQKFEDWVSIQTTLHNNREFPSKALPKLIAILCKKENESLGDFNLEERSKLFLELPITIAKDIEAFFLLNLNAYKSYMLLSSTENQRESIVLNSLNEFKNTLKQYREQTGMFSFTRLQIGICRLQLWWASVQLEKYFNSEVYKS